MAFSILPVLAFLAIVTVAPSIVALIDSLRELSLTVVGNRGEFVGLDHYRYLLGSDDKFYKALLHTAIFVIVVVPFQFICGLAIALWFERLAYGRRLLLTIIMIPTMTRSGSGRDDLAVPSYAVVRCHYLVPKRSRILSRNHDFLGWHHGVFRPNGDRYMGMDAVHSAHSPRGAHCDAASPDGGGHSGRSIELAHHMACQNTRSCDP